MASLDMSHFPAAEEHCELDLVALLDKFCGMVNLNVAVMVVNFRTQPYLLESSIVLLFVGLLVLTLLLINPLAVIHYSADGGLCVG